MSRFLLSSVCLLSALSVSACDDDDDRLDDFGPGMPSGPVTTGTLVFDWSIEGRKDADACVEAGAVTFDAIIVDEGYVIGDVSAPCEDFTTGVNLYTDDFLTRS